MIENDYVRKEEQFEELKKFDKKYLHFDIAGKNEKGVLLFKCKSLDLSLIHISEPTRP